MEGKAISKNAAFVSSSVSTSSQWNFSHLRIMHSILFLRLVRKWVQVFKNGLNKFCLKAVFDKFYLVHSRILCPKWKLQKDLIIDKLVLYF